MTKRPTLVIFDIDGTLLASAHLHHDLITAVLAGDGLDVTFQPWSAYRNYTDRGVLDDLFRHALGRGVTTADIERYEEAYRTALVEHLLKNPVSEIPGAGRLLAELAAMPDMHMCFATGSLRRMAIVKLGLLGIDGHTAALATGSDHLSREEIVMDAIGQACGHLGDTFDVVALGDGVWDERTADNLGIPFIAVQSGTHVFGDGPALKVADLATLQANQLAAIARPLRPAPVMAAPEGGQNG